MTKEYQASGSVLRICGTKPKRIKNHTENPEKARYIQQGGRKKKRRTLGKPFLWSNKQHTTKGDNTQLKIGSKETYITLLT